MPPRLGEFRDVTRGGNRGANRQNLQRATDHKEDEAERERRSAALLKATTAVLEPYGWVESDVAALLKRCNNDPTRLQIEIDHIFEDKLGHEHDSWSKQATTTEKKQKAEEAKLRRQERERQEEEDLEKLKATRRQVEEDRKQSARERAARLRAEEEAAAALKLSSAQALRSNGAPPPERKSAWRTADAAEEEEADAKKVEAPKAEAQAKTEGAHSEVANADTSWDEVAYEPDLSKAPAPFQAVTPEQPSRPPFTAGWAAEPTPGSEEADTWGAWSDGPAVPSLPSGASPRPCQVAEDFDDGVMMPHTYWELMGHRQERLYDVCFGSVYEESMGSKGVGVSSHVGSPGEPQVAETPRANDEEGGGKPSRAARKGAGGKAGADSRADTRERRGETRQGKGYAASKGDQGWTADEGGKGSGRPRKGGGKSGKGAGKNRGSDNEPASGNARQRGDRWRSKSGEGDS